MDNFISREDPPPSQNEQKSRSSCEEIVPSTNRPHIDGTYSRETITAESLHSNVLRPVNQNITTINNNFHNVNQICPPVEADADGWIDVSGKEVKLTSHYVKSNNNNNFFFD